MDDIKIENPIQPPVGTAISRKPELSSNSGSFGKMLTDSINQVNQHQVAYAQADRAVVLCFHHPPAAHIIPHSPA